MSERVLNAIEKLGHFLAKYWYLDMSIAVIGIAILLFVNKIRKRKT